MLLLKWCIVFSLCRASSIDHKLRYFETLSTSDILAQKKRSASGTQSEVSFRAFGMKFDLFLIHGSPVLSKGFQAKTVDRYGRETPFAINHEEFFTGHMAGDVAVRVSGHYEDGLLCASVRFPSEVYVVEPAWRHLTPAADTAMIVYRASDVILNHTLTFDGPAGGIARLSPSGASPRGDRTFASRRLREAKVLSPLGAFTNTRRGKRSASSQKLCSVLALADYMYYRDVGRSSKHNTVKRISTIVYNVGRNLKLTEWEAGLVGYGVHLAGIIIFTAFNDTPSHYNTDFAWTDTPKLMAFLTHERQIEDYCFGYLFTGSYFSSGVAGLSTMAEADLASPAGICGGRMMHEGTMYYWNGGYTSGMSYWQTPTTLLTAEIITTHEFGHLFGADHDTDDEDCAGDPSKGGRYVMWYQTTTGRQPNNRRFSPCSKRMVAAVIKAKARFCFEDDNVDMHCGNAALDKEEECDAGVLGDQCCSPDCKLVGDAKCSDINSPCCRQCQAAQQGTECSQPSRVCSKPAYCDGTSFQCPEAEPVVDQTPCPPAGQCHNGTCLSICLAPGQTAGRPLLPCTCVQDESTACRLCCREDSQDAACQPTDQVLMDGEPCDLGVCKNGVCQVLETSFFTLLFKRVESVPGVGAAATFMRSNVVLSVALLAVLVVLLVSWRVRKEDKRVQSETTIVAQLPADFEDTDSETEQQA